MDDHDYLEDLNRLNGLRRTIGSKWIAVPGNAARSYRLSKLAMLGLLLLPLAGCQNSNHPELRAVSGVVTYNDEPVADATVAFATQHSPRLATGRTDAQGRFSLSSYDPNDGALPGEHTVAVTKVEEPEESQSLSMDEALRAKPTRVRIRNLLPQKYASHDTTPLRATVPEDGTDGLKLRLSD